MSRPARGWFLILDDGLRMVGHRGYLADEWLGETHPVIPSDRTHE